MTSPYLVIHRATGEAHVLVLLTETAAELGCGSFAPRDVRPYDDTFDGDAPMCRGCIGNTKEAA